MKLLLSPLRNFLFGKATRTVVIIAAAVSAVFSVLVAARTPVAQIHPAHPSPAGITAVCATPPAGMVSWWPGENNGHDIVSHYNLALGGAGFATGEVGTAFSFNGSQFATPGDVAGLNFAGTTNVSVDGWINPAAAGGQGILFGKAVSGQSEYRVYINGGEVIGTVDTGTEHEVHSGYNAPANTWTHVALTYDGSTLAIYINGSLANTAAVSGTLVECGSCNSSQRSFTIGGRDDGFDFTGLIDEVEVFNTTVSATDISNIYNAGTTGKCRTCTPPPSGMIGWWPGDGNTKDIQGGSNGLLKNGATFGTGEVGQGFKFDGVDDYVLVPDNPSLNYTDFTYDAWIAPDPDSPSGDNYIICKGQAGTYLPLIEIRGTAGSHSWQAVVDGTNLFGPTVTYTYQHITVTRSGSVGKLYVDGVLQDTETVGTTPSAGYDLNFGQIPGFYNNGSFFKGRIDEVEIFNRALNGDEIQSIYDAGSLGKCKPTCVDPPPGLIDWWPGDNTATDIQGGNNGTPNTGVTFPNGKVDRAFGLNGIDQNIFIGNPANLQLQDFTIDAWIKRDSASVVSNNPAGPSQLAAIFSYGTNGYGFGLYPDGTLLLTKVGVSGTNSTGAKVSDTNFHHVAVTKSGSTVTFYVDGVTAAADASYDPGFVFTSNAYIGFFGSGGGNFFGTLDEVEIFNRALTPDEVAAIYNAGSAGKCKTVRFYVSNANNSTIEKFDINGVDLGTFADASAGLIGPSGLAFDASGNLFAADFLANKISKFDALGNAFAFADSSSGLNSTYGLAFDAAGNLYAANAGFHSILKYQPNGSVTTFATSGLVAPTDIVFDRAGNLYAVNDGNGTVEKFTSGGADQGVFASATLQNPFGARFDQSGQLYVSESTDNHIEKFDSNGNDLGAFASVGGANFYGIEFDPFGNLYVTDTGPFVIYKFDENGNRTTFISSPHVQGPVFIAVQLFSPTATSIQFDKPSYSVNEPAGTITLTVTRSGDLSGTSTVHYATADGTGASPAISPGDYTATSGDFTFNPNDTSMTFQVPIVVDDDSDPGSEPSSKTFTATLSNVTGGMLSGPATASVAITDVHDTISVTVSGINQGGGTTGGEGGAVSGAGTYDVGAKVDLVATPNDCFTFTSWTEGNNIVTTDPHLSFTASTGRNLVANFTIKAGCAGACNSFATATIADVSSEYPGRLAVHVVDGSGLDSNNPPNHDTDPTHMWMNGGDGQVGSSGADPDYPSQLGHITFNLNGTFSVSSFRVWNYNENTNFAYSNRGVQTLKISTSIDGVNFTPQINPATNTLIWTFDPAPTDPSYTGQVINFPTPLTAAYMRFDILTNYGVDPEDSVDHRFVGLSEIRFNMCPVSCVPPPANMTAWWKGDGNANDSVGGHNGSLMSGATFGAGEVGQGFSFNGVGAYVSVPGPVANFGTGDFTIDFWMQTSSTSGTREIINKRVCGDAPDAFEVRIGDTILVELLRNNDGTGSNVTSTRTYNDGQFHHIAIVRSGNTLSIYGDGTLDTSITGPNVGATNINNNLPLGIAGGGCADPNSGDGTATFLGVLDEIELFNRALSPDEIAGIVRAGGLGKCECTPPPAGLRDWWPAEGDASDLEGNNPGTLMNGATFAPGEVGQAFSFDANNSQYVDVGVVALGLQFTIDAWINTPALAEQAIFSKAGDLTATSDYYFVADPTGALVAFAQGPSGITIYSTAGGVITAGAWQHVAVTYDGNLGAGQKFQFYVNGNLVPSAPVASSDNGGPIQNSSASAKIGSLGDTGTRDQFTGLIDEVEVSQSVLTAQEISAIYHAGSAGKCRSCTPAPANMISWWPGDGNASDIQGGNNGTLQGGATFASGEVGQAFSFNGTSAHIEVPDSPSLNPTNQITIDTWVKTSSDSRQGLVSKLNQSFSSPDGSYDLTIVNASLVEFFVNGAGYLRPAASVCDGQWHHLAGTYDGNTMSLYVDGALAGSTSASGAITQSTRPLYLGAELRDNADSGFLNGQLDEVEIFNVALSGNQIAAIYDAGSGGKCKPATAPPDRQLFNISTRAEVGTGDNVAIGGFIIHTDPSGTTAAAKTRTAVTNTKRVLIRGIGPSLAAFNVANPLQDPVLELHDGNGAIITTNDNWGDAPNASDIQATGLAPSNSLESAILITLNADASYTAILSGKNNTTGVGLVEVYDMDILGNTHLVNISTRGFVDTGDNVLIGGLIVRGGTPARVVVRAIGPSMTALGVADALPDPTLELHDGNGALIASNDDWGSSPDAGAITAAGLNPSNSKESAILFTPAPGSYTAIVRGNGPTPTGVGLVEAFRLKN
jgi:hypothetical protein